MKFFHLSTCLCVGILSVDTLAGEHDLPLEAVKGGIQVMPKRFASISPDFKQTSPWIEVDESSSGPASGCPPTLLAFDCFEPNGEIPGWPTDGLYGLDCGMRSLRWYFYKEYCNMYCVNDMQVAPGFLGAQSERAEWAWWWQVNGEGTSERCLVALWTAETFDDTCTPPPSTHPYSGIIFDYGILPACTDWYYWTDTEDLLCDTGLYFQMPRDSRGAYLLFLANDYDGTNLSLATCAQPMLWGTKPGNPSYQGPIQWDDDNPIDGQHTHKECYDYVSECPDPLGICACFYAEHGTDPCLFLEIDSRQAGRLARLSLYGVPYGITCALVYDFRRGSLVYEGFGWCVDFGLDIRNPAEAQRHLLGLEPNYNRHSPVTFDVQIPCEAGGVTIYFQGAEMGECNARHPCMSNVLEVTFEPC